MADIALTIKYGIQNLTNPQVSTSQHTPQPTSFHLNPSSLDSGEITTISDAISKISKVTHLDNISESSRNEPVSDLSEPLQTSPSPSPTPEETFSAGVKRQFSKLSPPLFATDIFSLKKSSANNTRVPAPQKNPFQAEPDINFSTMSQLPSNVNMNDFMSEVMSRLSRLESALNEITRLQTALAASEASRKALEAQVAILKGSKPPPASAPAAPPPNGKLSAAAKAFEPSFASVAAKNLPKKRKAPAPPPAKRAAATIARLFAPKSDIPSGYQYIYYRNSPRVPLRKMRELLRAIGLNNSRILDIQYPVGDVVSFLVHNDYVLEFTSSMHKNGRGTSPLLEFDPVDPVNLKDPKYAALSPALRLQKAKEIENLRCLRSLTFVRRSVRVSVARSFLEKERINQLQFDAVLKEELAARESVSPPPKPVKKSSVEEQVAKKQRLSYLSYLLHHDEETSRILAYTASPVLSPQDDDAPMKD